MEVSMNWLLICLPLLLFFAWITALPVSESTPDHNIDNVLRDNNNTTTVSSHKSRHYDKDLNNEDDTANPIDKERDGHIHKRPLNNLSNRKPPAWILYRMSLMSYELGPQSVQQSPHARTRRSIGSGISKKPNKNPYRYPHSDSNSNGRSSLRHRFPSRNDDEHQSESPTQFYERAGNTNRDFNVRTSVEEQTSPNGLDPYERNFLAFDEQEKGDAPTFRVKGNVRIGTKSPNRATVTNASYKEKYNSPNNRHFTRNNDAIYENEHRSRDSSYDYYGSRDQLTMRPQSRHDSSSNREKHDDRYRNSNNRVNFNYHDSDTIRTDRKNNVNEFDIDTNRIPSGQQNNYQPQGEFMDRPTRMSQNNNNYNRKTPFNADDRSYQKGNLQNNGRSQYHSNIQAKHQNDNDSPYTENHNEKEFQLHNGNHGHHTNDFDEKVNKHTQPRSRFPERSRANNENVLQKDPVRPYYLHSQNTDRLHTSRSPFNNAISESDPNRYIKDYSRNDNTHDFLRGNGFGRNSRGSEFPPENDKSNHNHQPIRHRFDSPDDYRRNDRYDDGANQIAGHERKRGPNHDSHNPRTPPNGYRYDDTRHENGETRNREPNHDSHNPRTPPNDYRYDNTRHENGETRKRGPNHDSHNPRTPPNDYRYDNTRNDRSDTINTFDQDDYSGNNGRRHRDSNSQNRDEEEYRQQPAFPDTLFKSLQLARDNRHDGPHQDGSHPGRIRPRFTDNDQHSDCKRHSNRELGRYNRYDNRNRHDYPEPPRYYKNGHRANKNDRYHPRNIPTNDRNDWYRSRNDKNRSSDVLDGNTKTLPRMQNLFKAKRRSKRQAIEPGPGPYQYRYDTRNAYADTNQQGLSRMHYRDNSQYIPDHEKNRIQYAQAPQQNLYAQQNIPYESQRYQYYGAGVENRRTPHESRRNDYYDPNVASRNIEHGRPGDNYNNERYITGQRIRDGQEGGIRYGEPPRGHYGINDAPYRTPSGSPYSDQSPYRPMYSDRSVQQRPHGTHEEGYPRELRYRMPYQRQYDQNENQYGYGDNEGRPLHYQQNENKPLYSQRNDARPPLSQQNEGRPLYYQLNEGSPLYSQRNDDRPLYSQHNDGRPLYSKQNDGRPLYYQQNYGRPLYSQHNDDRPLYSQRNDNRPNAYRHPSHDPSPRETPHGGQLAYHRIPNNIPKEYPNQNPAYNEYGLPNSQSQIPYKREVNYPYSADTRDRRRYYGVPPRQHRQEVSNRIPQPPQQTNQNQEGYADYGHSSPYHRIFQRSKEHSVYDDPARKRSRDRSPSYDSGSEYRQQLARPNQNGYADYTGRSPYYEQPSTPKDRPIYEHPAQERPGYDPQERYNIINQAPSYINQQQTYSRSHVYSNGPRAR